MTTELFKYWCDTVCKTTSLTEFFTNSFIQKGVDKEILFTNLTIGTQSKESLEQFSKELQMVIGRNAIATEPSQQGIANHNNHSQPFNNS